MIGGLETELFALPLPPGDPVDPSRMGVTTQFFEHDLVWAKVRIFAELLNGNSEVKSDTKVAVFEEA